MKRLSVTARQAFASIAPAVLVAAGSAPPAGQEIAPASIDEVLARTRAALGGGEAPTALDLSGRADVRGVDTRFSFASAPDGRFAYTVDGPLGESSGFDGAVAWTTDAGGLASPVELEDDEVLRLSKWFRSGHLFTPASGAIFAPVESEAGDRAFAVRLAGGLRTARVVIDDASALPSRLVIPTVFGDEAWSLFDWRTVGSRRVPHRVERRAAAGVVETWVVERAAEATGGYSPATGSSPARFDASLPPAVELLRTRTGHLLVRPRLDGRDAGWFILDTGAGIPVIAPLAADALSLEALGRTFVGGAGGQPKATRYRLGRTFELGGLTFGPLRYVELDLADIGRALGHDVAGVIGYELFRRAVVSLDLTAPALSLFDPATFARDGLEWSTLVIHEKHPHVRARFEGAHEGLFRIDSGAGSVGVVFHSPAVSARKLLEGRDVREVAIGGAGGVSRALMGEVSGFEIGGRRVERASAIFSAAGSGALDDPYTEGTVGAGVLDGLEMILDYGRRRVAFSPRAAPASR